ncbi:MAG: hypothetical protein FWC41_02975 [Firmicutes bacterium]|nr:hypothetical protein [Bacillota bacterium]
MIEQKIRKKLAILFSLIVAFPCVSASNKPVVSDMKNTKQIKIQNVKQMRKKSLSDVAILSLTSLLFLCGGGIILNEYEKYKKEKLTKTKLSEVQDGYDDVNLYKTLDHVEENKSEKLIKGLSGDDDIDGYDLNLEAEKFLQGKLDGIKGSLKEQLYEDLKGYYYYSYGEKLLEKYDKVSEKEQEIRKKLLANLKKQKHYSHEEISKEEELIEVKSIKDLEEHYSKNKIKKEVELFNKLRNAKRPIDSKSKKDNVSDISYDVDRITYDLDSMTEEKDTDKDTDIIKDLHKFMDSWTYEKREKEKKIEQEIEQEKNIQKIQLIKMLTAKIDPLKMGDRYVKSFQYIKNLIENYIKYREAEVEKQSLENYSVNKVKKSSLCNVVEFKKEDEIYIISSQDGDYQSFLYVFKKFIDRLETKINEGLQNNVKLLIIGSPFSNKSVDLKKPIKNSKGEMVNKSDGTEPNSDDIKNIKNIEHLNGMEILTTILAAKKEFPENVHIIKDCSLGRSSQLNNTAIIECKSKYGDNSKELLRDIYRLSYSMPSVVNFWNDGLAVSGGIPNKFENIHKFIKTISQFGYLTVCSLLEDEFSTNYGEKVYKDHFHYDKLLFKMEFINKFRRELNEDEISKTELGTAFCRDDIKEKLEGKFLIRGSLNDSTFTDKYDSCYTLGCKKEPKYIHIKDKNIQILDLPKKV